MTNVNFFGLKFKTHLIFALIKEIQHLLDYLID